MKKSWTSVGLSLCMVLTLTPVTAIYADEFDAHEGVMDQEIVEEKDLDLVEEEEPVVEDESEEVIEQVESEPEKEVEVAPMMLAALHLYRVVWQLMKQTFRMRTLEVMF